jgi:hypothetical protein
VPHQVNKCRSTIGSFAFAAVDFTQRRFTIPAVGVYVPRPDFVTRTREIEFLLSCPTSGSWPERS